MTLNEFTENMHAAFTERETRGGYQYIHKNSGNRYFAIALEEEALSFGEAMGYAPEKDRPVLDPIQALHAACYADAGNVAISLYVHTPAGHSEPERLRRLLEQAFNEPDQDGDGEVLS